MKRQLTKDEKDICSKQVINLLEKERILKEEIEETEVAMSLQQYKLKIRYLELGLRANLRNMNKDLKIGKNSRDQKIEEVAKNRNNIDELKDHIHNGVVIKDKKEGK